MKPRLTLSLYLCLLSLTAWNCSTPQPVLHLASHGAAMTSQVGSELDKFVARSNWAYEQRLMGIKRLSTGDIESRAQFAFENYTAERASMRDQTEMVKLIRDLADYRAKIRDESLKQQAQVEKQLEVGTSLTVPKDKITGLQKAFEQLSEELSTEEWLMFAIAYGREVQANVKKLDAAAKQAENKANNEDKKATK